MVLYLYDSEAKYERNKDKLNNGQPNNLPPKETNNINDDKNINNQQNVNLQNDTKIDTKIDMKTNMNTNITTANVNDNFSQQHNDPNINQNIDQLSPLNRPDNYIQGFDYNGMSQSGNYNLLNDNKTDDKMDNKKTFIKKDQHDFVVNHSRNIITGNRKMRGMKQRGSTAVNNPSQYINHQQSHISRTKKGLHDRNGNTQKKKEAKNTNKAGQTSNTEAQKNANNTKNKENTEDDNPTNINVDKNKVVLVVSPTGDDKGQEKETEEPESTPAEEPESTPAEESEPTPAEEPAQSRHTRIEEGSTMRIQSTNEEDQVVFEPVGDDKPESNTEQIIEGNVAVKKTESNTEAKEAQEAQENETKTNDDRIGQQVDQNVTVVTSTTEQVNDEEQQSPEQSPEQSGKIVRSGTSVTTNGNETTNETETTNEGVGAVGGSTTDSGNQKKQVEFRINNVRYIAVDGEDGTVRKIGVQYGKPHENVAEDNPEANQQANQQANQEANQQANQEVNQDKKDSGIGSDVDDEETNGAVGGATVSPAVGDTNNEKAVEEPGQQTGEQQTGEQQTGGHQTGGQQKAGNSTIIPEQEKPIPRVENPPKKDLKQGRETEGGIEVGRNAEPGDIDGDNGDEGYETGEEGTQYVPSASPRNGTNPNEYDWEPPAEASQRIDCEFWYKEPGSPPWFRGVKVNKSSSGFPITIKGKLYIVSNCHGVTDCIEDEAGNKVVTVYTNESEGYPAKVRMVDRFNDLTFLELLKPIPGLAKFAVPVPRNPKEFSQIKFPPRRAPIMLKGFPGGNIAETLTEGKLTTACTMPYALSGTLGITLGTDAVVAPGSSGGAVYYLSKQKGKKKPKRKLAGVIFEGADSEYFMIPCCYLRADMDRFQEALDNGATGLVELSLLEPNITVQGVMTPAESWYHGLNVGETV